MKSANSPNVIVGLIEYRGRILAAEVHVPLLVFDAKKFALNGAQANRRDAFDPDFSAEERRALLARAEALDRWVNGGCEKGGVSFDVDVALYLRSAFAPAVVTRESLNEYLDGVLNVSKVIPLKAVDEPEFAVRHNAGEPELWLTDAPRLRSPRLHAGPDVRVVEASKDNLKELIAIQTTSVAA